MIKIVLISAVVICATSLLVPWRLPAASSAKRAVAARSSAPASVPAPAPTSARVYALPPALVKPPALATLPFRRTKPRAEPGPALHPRAVTAVPTGVRGDWALKFDGEFTGAGLDASQWSTGWYGSGITPPANDSEDDCYDPAEVSQGGGVLSLSVIQHSETCGSAEQYAGGLVSTMGKFSFTYGFIEARVWLPPAAAGSSDEVANWPGVWADGQNWPQDGEIDIAEGINGQVCAHFHGPDNPDGVGAGGGSGCPSGNYAGWHTFAADWEPGDVTFYYDGADIGSVTSGVTSAPMFLVLDNAAQATAQVPATMKVAYVRVWQHP